MYKVINNATIAIPHIAMYGLHKGYFPTKQPIGQHTKLRHANSMHVHYIKIKLLDVLINLPQIKW